MPRENRLVALVARRGARPKIKGEAVRAEGERTAKSPNPDREEHPADSHRRMIQVQTAAAAPGKFYGSRTPGVIVSATSPASTAADRSEGGNSIRMGSRRGRFGRAAASAPSSACETAQRN